ncbi:MAG: hypothetical protein FWD50_04195 [Betaproteobacteria bacterium]|nr:hypothetical protein [Betaproteobacteria bacterium]
MKNPEQESRLRQMLKSGRSLAALAHLFPKDCQYSREQWMAEAEMRQRDREPDTATVV